MIDSQFFCNDLLKCQDGNRLLKFKYCLISVSIFDKYNYFILVSPS